jgi:methanogenic corrinoid protein MtbC1
MSVDALIDDGCYQRYLQALQDGDGQSCAALLNEQLSRSVPLKAIYIDLVQRAMYEVGTRWETNQISVATEHLASATTELLLARLYPRLFALPHIDRRALVACVPQEYHRIGPRMVADFFELHGWHAFSLGAGLTPANLIEQIDERRPDVVGLSMSLRFNAPYLEMALDAISSEYPDLPVLLGGQAFQGDGEGRDAREALLERYAHLRYCGSLDDLERYIAHA